MYSPNRGHGGYVRPRDGGAAAAAAAPARGGGGGGAAAACDARTIDLSIY
jgi:hypothetical protein